MAPVWLVLVLAGGLRSAPAMVSILTPRGESQLPVVLDSVSGPAVAAPALLSALNGTMTTSDSWAEVTVARQPFRFLLGASLYSFNGRLEPLAGLAYIARDTVFLPFQFLTEILPRVFSERFRYDSQASRFIEVGPKPIAAAPSPPRLPNGLRPGHRVTIDPGHGGVDPGNPGLYFPRGVTESDVTLKIGLLLRDELRRRGVTIRMTRTTDTLIALEDRGAFCSESCDLFLSLHVNSLKRRPGYTATRGFETYFLAEARTEDAIRVEQMENDAVRYERSSTGGLAGGGIDFILKDLQLNEYLRESARAAELIQRQLEEVHTGENRGVKQAGFMVLTTARRPAVLAELGYSTNPEDGRLLTNPRSQRALASSLADAVVAYLLEYERKTGAAADSGSAP